MEKTIAKNQCNGNNFGIGGKPDKIFSGEGYWINAEHGIYSDFYLKE